MAVYTEVSDDALIRFVAEYDIGEVLSCKGIAEGVENSNYLLQTDRGPFILTLYEKRVVEEELPFFLGLMDHLAARDVACPVPVHGRDGAALRRLCGRPAAIVTFLSGMCPRRILPEHCYQVGVALARLHQAAADFPGRRENALGPEGWRRLETQCHALADTVEKGLAAELAADVADITHRWPRDLPVGVIHADLFHDNVFFHRHRLSGIIDFYFACTDFLAYDLSICLNAWCFEGSRSFNVTKARSLLNGYSAVRPLTAAETEALPLLARGSALRFLLTRLYDWVHTPADALVRPKDPRDFLSRLRFHRTVASAQAYLAAV